MLRRLTAIPILLLWVCVLSGVARSAVWPDRLGTFHKASAGPAAVANKALWNEYGLNETEKAEYVDGSRRFTATSYRLADPTGALAAYQWQRPLDALPSSLGKHTAETSDTVLMVFGNYLLRFEGWKPKVAEIAPLLSSLPLLDQSSLPALSGYLPGQDLVPNSQRYVLGPVSLGQFEPQIPPAVAAFHFGAEAQLGKYKANGGEIGLAIFSYPTPQIAREQVVEFQKLPGALAKRSGPLVAVIFSPVDPNQAEVILSRVRYEATVSWSQHVPSRRDNIGDLIITAFVLIGFLLAFAIVAGLAFGGVRALLRLWLGAERTSEPMIVLKLRDW